MFVPFQSTAFAPTVQLVQESTWGMNSLQDGAFESAAEQGQPLTVGKIATLTHLFTYVCFTVFVINITDNSKLVIMLDLLLLGLYIAHDARLALKIPIFLF